MDSRRQARGKRTIRVKIALLYEKKLMNRRLVDTSGVMLKERTFKGETSKRVFVTSLLPVVLANVLRNIDTANKRRVGHQ